MKHLQNLAEIEQVKAPALIKFGQPGCVPCQIAEDNLVSMESEFDGLPFYSCSNVDVVVELGLQHTPFIKLLTDDGEVTNSDVGVMMDSEALKNWISENYKKQ